MRMRRYWLAIVLGLALTTPAWTQTTVTFGGTSPTQTINQAVDTQALSSANGISQSLVSTPSSITDVFTNNSLAATGAPLVGSSAYPGATGAPGPGYLSAFGYQQPLAGQQRWTAWLSWPLALFTWPLSLF